ncbi:hypothetical protein F8A10_12040 [Paracoccus kondratievae]|uniref:helix-turn-helix domain-containing protein n=1 Tax=Paracoccus kondratievae TaxID=135740 RepID=UPI0012666F5B|nr:helix-turn-helix domain-containing protein [Paracoccus kondratievae]QFQ88241.1 hypothetical protein F8A10_12040 [Paracoccus kondratievae]
MSGPVEIARAAWGEDIPEWVERLAEECAATSQNKVARRLNRSAALVSNVLRRKYLGDMAAVEEVVRGVFMFATVQCPAQGEISTAACRDWMRKAGRFVNVNAQRVRMFRACNSCPRYKGASK